MTPRVRLGSALAVALLAAAEAGCRPDAARPDVVLIVIDTLRADHLGCYGYGRPTSPRIDRLAERATLFEQASAVAPYTRPSTATILTGLYPSVHGAITHQDAIAPGVRTLAQVLKTAGYRTIGIYRNGNVGETFGFGRGFDRYVVPDEAYWEQLGVPWEERAETLWSEIDDSRLTRLALRFLAQGHEAPLFLYLHLQGGHDPYTPPRETVRFLEGSLGDTPRVSIDRSWATGTCSASLRESLSTPGRGIRSWRCTTPRSRSPIARSAPF